MENHSNKIMLYELLGFLSIILISWANEIINLSEYIFGGNYTPSWQEASFETCIVISVAVPIMYSTWRISKKLHYLEDFLKMCAWCRKINQDDRWLSIEEFISENLDTKTSHGICPECKNKFINNLKTINKTN